MKHSFSSREKRIIGIIFFVHFCLIVDFMLIMPLGTHIMGEFGVAANRFSDLIATHTIISGITGIFAAFFVDRFERKKLLTIAMWGFFISALLSGTARSYHWLLLARCTSGVFVGIAGSLILSIISDVVAIEKRGTALGIVMAAFALAAIAGIPIGLTLANQFTWHAAFLFLAGTTAIATIVTMFKLDRFTSHLSAANHHWMSSVATLKQLALDKNCAIALMFLAILILGHFSVIPFLFPSIIANVKISQAQLPLIYLSGGFVSLITPVIFGLLADRWGIKKAFATALIGSLPVIYFVTRMGPSTLPVTILFVSCFYVFMGGRMTPAMTLITSTVSLENRGKFLSLASAINHLAAGLAAAIAGAIVVKGDDGGLHHFPQVGLLAIGFSVVALLLAPMIRSVES